MVATSERFFGHGLLPIALYEPDLSALQGGPARVVVAGGTTSKGEFPQRTAAALAERLGTPLVDFPGGHAGFASDATEFAAVLRRHPGIARGLGGREPMLFTPEALTRAIGELPRPIRSIMKTVIDAGSRCSCTQWSWRISMIGQGAWWAT